MATRWLCANPSSHREVEARARLTPSRLRAARAPDTPVGPVGFRSPWRGDFSSVCSRAKRSS